MPESVPRPESIELSRTESLRIRWTDGVISTYPLAALRKACPCATCRDERERASRSLLPLAASAGEQAAMATAENLELVGRYALRILWRDGHHTGIYDYELLRRLGDELKS
jgi:DUF971 family protein